VDAELRATIAAFEEFLKKLKSFDAAVRELPTASHSGLRLKLQNRLVTKTMERQATTLTPCALFKSIVDSIQEIEEMLAGERSLPQPTPLRRPPGGE
jgi:hypothetical protein